MLTHCFQSTYELPSFTVKSQWLAATFKHIPRFNESISDIPKDIIGILFSAGDLGEVIFNFYCL